METATAETNHRHILTCEVTRPTRTVGRESPVRGEVGGDVRMVGALSKGGRCLETVQTPRRLGHVPVAEDTLRARSSPNRASISLVTSPSLDRILPRAADDSDNLSVIPYQDPWSYVTNGSENMTCGMADWMDRVASSCLNRRLSPANARRRSTRWEANWRNKQNNAKQAKNTQKETATERNRRNMNRKKKKHLGQFRFC